jgi:hypothetical protein
MYFRARAICSLVGFANFFAVFFTGLNADSLFDFEGDASSGKFHWVTAISVTETICLHFARVALIGIKHVFDQVPSVAIG